jgi:hypothetical protein
VSRDSRNRWNGTRSSWRSRSRDHCRFLPSSRAAQSRSGLPVPPQPRGVARRRRYCARLGRRTGRSPQPLRLLVISSETYYRQPIGPGSAVGVRAAVPRHLPQHRRHRPAELGGERGQCLLLGRQRAADELSTDGLAAPEEAISAATIPGAATQRTSHRCARRHLSRMAHKVWRVTERLVSNTTPARCAGSLRCNPRGLMWQSHSLRPGPSSGTVAATWPLGEYEIELLGYARRHALPRRARRETAGAGIRNRIWSSSPRALE